MHSNLVQEVKGPIVDSGEETVWDSMIQIPDSVPPTNLGNISNYPIVTCVQYFLQVKS